MMIDAKTAMAPTDRSTPAVRMMIVWPMASVPTTVTWEMISDRLAACRNRSGATRLNAVTITTRTMNGPSAGYLCSVRWTRSRVRRRAPLLVVDRRR